MDWIVETSGGTFQATQDRNAWEICWEALRAANAHPDDAGVK